MILSVVTPSLNQARYLTACLDSVREAAENLHPPCSLEHRVVDGGSTDKTIDILAAQTFAQWSSRKDSGQSQAVNRGWQDTTGEILCFLCADDLWLPQTASLVLQTFMDNPDADVVYGDYYFLEGETCWMRRRIAGPFSHSRLLQHNFLSQPAVFLRRNVFEEFGGLREDLKYCMDHEFWLRIAGKTRWVYVQEPLAAMRLHADAKTSSQLAAAWWETAEMAKPHGQGSRFFRKALWMSIAGQFLYRVRRKIYRRIGPLMTKNSRL